ncbi:MAG: hypothetical protein ACXWDE_02730, partial [Aeromicrobium sp.]
MNLRRSLIILVGAVVAFVVTQVFMSSILGDLTPKLLELQTTFAALHIAAIRTETNLTSNHPVGK